MISWRQQNTKSQFFASCHHGPGLQFLFLFLPHNLLSAHDFCSIQYFACFSHLELWHYQGCYLPRICNPESLVCARMLEKLRQPGSVDVVGKKRQSVREAHLSRMKIWNDSLSDRHATCWGLYSFIISLGCGFYPPLPHKKAKWKGSHFTSCATCLHLPVSQALSIRLCIAVNQHYKLAWDAGDALTESSTGRYCYVSQSGTHKYYKTIQGEWCCSKLHPYSLQNLKMAYLLVRLPVFPIFYPWALNP